MGVGASTHVKEIRIDQNDEKWSSPLPKDDGNNRKRSIIFAKRFSSADTKSSNQRRNKNLDSLLETTERRALDAEQRVEQLEREVASLELKKMELSQEVQWLKKQLSEHIHHTNITEPIKFSEGLSLDSTTMNGRHKLSEELKLDATSLLMMQEKQHTEEMLKMKMELTKEIQEATLLAQTEKIQMDKENKALQDRLQEIQLLYDSKRNQSAHKATENDQIPFANDQLVKNQSHFKLLDDGLAALHASLNSQNFADLIGSSDQQEKQNDQEKNGVSRPTSIRPTFSATKRGSLTAMSPTRRRHSFEPKQRFSIRADHLLSKNQDLDHYENGSTRGVLSSCKRKDSLVDNPMIPKMTSRIISSRGRGSTKPFLSFVRTGSIDHFENILPGNLSHNVGHALTVENVRNSDSLLLTSSKMMTENSTFSATVDNKHTIRPNKMIHSTCE